jgi:hypothetical protein
MLIVAYSHELIVASMSLTSASRYLGVLGAPVGISLAELLLKRAASAVDPYTRSVRTSRRDAACIRLVIQDSLIRRADFAGNRPIES